MRCQCCGIVNNGTKRHCANRLVVLDIGWSFLCRYCFGNFEFWSFSGTARSILSQYMGRLD